MLSQARWLHATRKGPGLARIGVQGTLSGWVGRLKKLYLAADHKRKILTYS
jgi:hypothetical protein